MDTQLDRLMNAVLPVAKGTLEKKKEFFPFGANINIKDEIIMTLTNESEEELSSEKMISLIEDGLRQYVQEKSTTAVALCADVEIVVEGMKDKVNAIRVHLEDEGGTAYQIFLPYTISEVGEITYGDLYGEERDALYFV